MRPECSLAVRGASGQISAKSRPKLPRGHVVSSGGGVAWGVWTVECIVSS